MARSSTWANLKAREQSLFMLLWSRAGRAEWYNEELLILRVEPKYARQAWLAEQSGGCDERTIRTALRRLEKADMLRAQRTLDGNRYVLILPAEVLAEVAPDLAPPESSGADRVESSGADRTKSSGASTYTREPIERTNNTTSASDDDGTPDVEGDVGADHGGGGYEILRGAGVWEAVARQYASADQRLLRFLVKYAARNGLGAPWIASRLQNPGERPHEYALIRELVTEYEAIAQREADELEQRRQRVAEAWPDIVSMDPTERARAHLACCGSNARLRGDAASLDLDEAAAKRWSKVNLIYDEGQAADRLRGMIRENLDAMRAVWNGSGAVTETRAEQNAAVCGISLDDLATEPPKPVSCNVDRLLDLDETQLRDKLKTFRFRQERAARQGRMSA